MDEMLAEVRDSIASVLAEECPGLAVHKFIDGHDPLDERLAGLATELGWLLIALPEAAGGIGLGVAGLAALNLELGRVAAPAAFLANSVALDALVNSAAADDAAVAALVREVVAGSATLAIAARLDVAAQDGMMLLGESSAKAALLPGEGDDLVLVDLADAALERVVIWDETRGMVRLLRAAVEPIATLAGMKARAEAAYAIALAADSVGAAHGILDRTVTFMKEREQFGRPIGSFQALKHRVADHLVNAISAEQMVLQAVEHVDAGGPGAGLWSALAKANVTDAAVKVCADCVQLHGGVGFTREYDPHVYLKRVRLNEMLLAPNGRLRDRAEQAFDAALQGGHDVLEIA